MRPEFEPLLWDTLKPENRSDAQVCLRMPRSSSRHRYSLLGSLLFGGEEESVDNELGARWWVSYGGMRSVDLEKMHKYY